VNPSATKGLLLHDRPHNKKKKPFNAPGRLMKLSMEGDPRAGLSGGTLSRRYSGDREAARKSEEFVGKEEGKLVSNDERGGGVFSVLHVREKRRPTLCMTKKEAVTNGSIERAPGPRAKYAPSLKRNMLVALTIMKSPGESDSDKIDPPRGLIK